VKAKEIGTLTFVDAESNDEAVAIVRISGANTIGLCLSLRSNGDVEAFMRRDDARRVVEALTAALNETQPE
jgi:hypothetical protein